MDTAATKICSIYFDEEINVVVMEWNGYSTSEQCKQGTKFDVKPSDSE